jgi:hypothetical protein
METNNMKKKAVATGTKIPLVKTCPVCKHTQPVENFYRDTLAKDGRKYLCKTCMTAYYKNREKNKLKPKTGLNPVTQRLNHTIKQRAQTVQQKDGAKNHDTTKTPIPA